MKKKLTLALWILIAAVVRPGAGQDRECPEWSFAQMDPHTMHWAQSPMGPSISLGRLALADDFLCTETGPIRRIHLWGSFLDDVQPKGGAGSLRFELAICADTEIKGRDNLLGSAEGPGVVLWTRVFEPGEYLTTTGYASGVLYDPETGDLYHDQVRSFGVEYTFCIEEEPFVMEEGTVYWLAVRELSLNPEKYAFGWQSTRPELHWNTAALYRVNDDAQAGWTEISWPEGWELWQGEPLDLAFVISNGEASAKRDLGGAPDSSNSFPGVVMTAYEGVQANFPTVYRAGSPPYGPMHLHPRDRFFLGRNVSLENEADVGLDEDWGPLALLPNNNLLPLQDVARADGEHNDHSRPGARWDYSDDGLVIDWDSFPVSFPACQRTRLDYRVTVTDPNATEAYVNVWCDWNRDGDWNDTLVCAGRAAVPEWAVQNHRLAFAGAGQYVFTSPSFRCWHPEGHELDPIWVRITLAEQEWTPQADGGAGPEGGYQYGETEDYRFPPVQRSPLYDWGDAPDSLAAPGYPVLEAHNGARHLIGGPWLGSDADPGSDDEDTWGAGDDTWGANDSPDAEEEGQPDTDARGDDNNAEDDEDGVLIPPMTAGLSTSAMIKVSGGGGIVQLWIDFNGDKKWQSGEMVFNDFRPDGVHAIPIGVPSTAVVGKTFARVRISTSGGLTPEGPADDGEVEDHEVQIIAPAPTILPGAVTQCPVVATTCPTVLTKCPPTQTQCPVEATKCPSASTTCPPMQTYCPAESTKCPASSTKCPPVQTACPPSKTQCPALETECPLTPTKCVTVYTECPAVQTYCPPVETKCPVVSTQCPPVSTSCPAVSTQCPTSATRCPPTQTQCPAESTRCPPVQTYCPAENTKCPASSTKCPPVQTACPPSKTQCPALETECPLTPTKCVTVYTECPAVQTYCPPVETKCPVVSTQCPPVSTSCPAVSTQCPTSATRCPPTLTLCPKTLTKCSVCGLNESDLKPAGGPYTLQVECPVVETDCPSLREYLVTATARQRATPE